MTNEEKELLIKDLCGRLPYGVKIHGPKENDDILWELDYNIDIKKIVDDGWLPYLRPMESMTEDEFYELKELGVSLPSTFEEYYGQMQYYSGGGEWGIIDVEIEDIIKYMNYLNAHHFDYRGLISMGLALEAPEDMYK